MGICQAVSVIGHELRQNGNYAAPVSPSYYNLDVHVGYDHSLRGAAFQLHRCEPWDLCHKYTSIIFLFVLAGGVATSFSSMADPSGASTSEKSKYVEVILPPLEWGNAR